MKLQSIFEIPLKSNNDGGYKLSSSLSVYNTERLYNIFDKDIVTSLSIWDGMWGRFVNIILELPIAKTVVGYSITCKSSYYEIKSWKIQGSNDNINWIDLDIRTVTNWSVKTQTFSFDNTTAYKYYKFLPTGKISSYNGGCYIEELDYLCMEYETKYLMQDNNNILKTINNDIMINSPLQTLTTDNFMTNGFDDLSLLSNKLNDIDNPFKIYMYKE